MNLWLLLLNSSTGTHQGATGESWRTLALPLALDQQDREGGQQHSPARASVPTQECWALLSVPGTAQGLWLHCDCPESGDRSAERTQELTLRRCHRCTETAAQQLAPPRITGAGIRCVQESKSL